MFLFLWYAILRDAVCGRCGIRAFFNLWILICFSFFPRILYGANAVQPHSGLANRTLKGFNGISPTCNVGTKAAKSVIINSL